VIECRRLGLCVAVHQHELVAAGNGPPVDKLVRVLHPARLVGQTDWQVLIAVSQRHRPLIVGERALRCGFEGQKGQAGNGKSSERGLSH